MPECRIEDFALIGDCETAALIGRDGSVDWLCWPRFDSEACFAALLGTRDNGCWRIAPADGSSCTSRRYRPGTLILESRYETSSGVVSVVDFMPPREKASDVVRLVIGEQGEVAMRMELSIRFGYGQIIPWVTRLDDGTLRAIAGPDMVVLRTPADIRGENRHTVSEFVVRAGETMPFVLTYGLSHENLPGAINADTALADTERFWAEWSGRYRPGAGGTRCPPHWEEAILRSLITLKALTYAPTGGMVAAATTSLPEWIGGVRNWDYRYCWLRDSALTLFAFMSGGYYDEAKAWRDWLIRAMAGNVEQMQIMFGVAGERRLHEWEVDWLPGFAGSKPVRIGNAAHNQLQLDVFGEVMGVFHLAREGGIEESPEGWPLQRALLDRLDAIWQEPDHGIWETRGDPQHFTFSKVMAWAAFDRSIRSAEEFGLDDAPLDRWRATRDEIHREVSAKAVCARTGSFVQAYGSDEMDATLLLLPIVGFVTAEDPRYVASVARIERELLVDGLVLRYRTDTGSDGLPSGEGVFLACSFWLVSAYTALGRLDEARNLFERLLAIRNDVGLLSEEYDPREGRQLGNVPQAFSHLALIYSANRLAEALARRSSGDRPMVTRLSCKDSRA